jgi:hypothetical protein
MLIYIWILPIAETILYAVGMGYYRKKLGCGVIHVRWPWVVGAAFRTLGR